MSQREAVPYHELHRILAMITTILVLLWFRLVNGIPIRSEGAGGDSFDNIDYSAVEFESSRTKTSPSWTTVEAENGTASFESTATWDTTIMYGKTTRLEPKILSIVRVSSTSVSKAGRDSNSPGDGGRVETYADIQTPRSWAHFKKSALNAEEGRGYVSSRDFATTQTTASHTRKNDTKNQKAPENYEARAKIYGEPEKVYGKPAKVYGEPAKVYGEPEKVYGEPAKVYGKPAKVYGEPEKVYGEPAKVYGEPEKVYGEPEKVYGEPEKVYGEPEKVYGEPEKVYVKSEKVYEEAEKVYGDYDDKTVTDYSYVLTTTGTPAAATAAIAEDKRKSSYVVDNGQYRKYRVEQRTADGFIVGEYGMVSHRDGSLRGVRYAADSNINPRLIYETLAKFLSLK